MRRVAIAFLMFAVQTPLIAQDSFRVIRGNSMGYDEPVHGVRVTSSYVPSEQSFGGRYIVEIGQPVPGYLDRLVSVPPGASLVDLLAELFPAQDSWSQFAQKDLNARSMVLGVSAQNERAYDVLQKIAQRHHVLFEIDWGRRSVIVKSAIPETTRSVASSGTQRSAYEKDVRLTDSSDFSRDFIIYRGTKISQAISSILAKQNWVLQWNYPRDWEIPENIRVLADDPIDAAKKIVSKIYKEGKDAFFYTDKDKRLFVVYGKS